MKNNSYHTNDLFFKLSHHSILLIGIIVISLVCIYLVFNLHRISIAIFIESLILLMISCAVFVIILMSDQTEEITTFSSFVSILLAVVTASIIKFYEKRE